MLTNQYIVLFSGDRLLMKTNYWVENIKEKEAYLNNTLQEQIKHYMPFIKETAERIELEPSKF